MRAAFSLCCCDNGPVRLLLARTRLETSAPSLTRKTEVKLGEVSALYDVLFVSKDKLVAADATVAAVACVETDELVSFLVGGDPESCLPGGVGVLGPPGS